MIHIQHLSKWFGDVRAVEDVSMSIAPGELVVIQGPSGSGKTTLLRLLAGLDVPDQGEISLDGELVSSPQGVHSPYARGIGMVFQRAALWPHMTVSQNIRFAMEDGVHTRDEISVRVTQLLEALGLQGYNRRRPHQLSGGEARRVALARALAGRPGHLLLDEPLTSLDPERKARVLQLIKDQAQETQATLLYVTHDVQDAAEVGGRQVSMVQGRIVS